jgi:tetratricopeptide (TPR) repeat protein
MDEAADYFRTALERCPDYGRAHNGLARALEGKRLRINVHRADDSLRFATKEMPRIEKIDEYVINWKSLSPRHQKQVALAIEPWKLYIPLLTETGHRHYVKPLHERLSQAPGMETIKDQRISYDSRLWDDVRGCGGYTTITGIEDVERCIYSSYNTVLHELTHQVHGVFPPEDAQRLSDRYQDARNLEAAGTKVFMSQYQAASVWEYFAEGANGYYSPRRDQYDTREIVHERLFELDTTLARLVEYYVKAPNLSECYPVAYVNAAENEIEQQKLAEALNFAQKAYARAPRAEVVLAALSSVYSLMDDDRKATAFADSLLIYFPKKARAYTRVKTAHFFNDGDALEAVKWLEKGVGVADTTEEKALRQALGDALWYAGRYDEAAEQYRTILARHTKNSDALWGLGSALGDAGNSAGADSAFELALLEQSGVTDMRLDYARVLLKANKVSEAETQVHEAEILSPDDPSVLTMKGQLADARGDPNAALKVYDQAIKACPYDRLPQVLRVEVLFKTGKSKIARKELKRLEKAMKSDVPAWKYHPTRAAYTPAYLWPSFQRDLLNSTRKAMP